MDTMRKYCKDELPKGCPDCQKEDVFGDICHAYQAYEQGRADALEIDMDKPMHFTDEQKAWIKNYIIINAERQRADAIEFISDELIYPLLDEYDRGLWERINHIELAREWIKVLDDNPYPKVKNHTEARKRDLRQWIAEKLKE